MRYLTSALVGLLSMCTVAYADAQDFMLEAIDWITANSDFEYNGEPLPELREVQQEYLQIMMYGEIDFIRLSQTENVNMMTFAALYEEEKNIIYLSEDIDLSESSYVLVHEAVHFLQSINGHYETAPCVGALEHDAYDLQGRWQEATNDPNPKPDPFAVIFATMCPEPYG